MALTLLAATAAWLSSPRWMFSLARMDEGSSVIYKIVKINNAPLSILNDFVKPSKKEKKK
jgi:hypothetical protein